MINVIDEYLHEYKKSKDWIESFNLHFIDKKSKLFGFADINYYFDSMRTDFCWGVFYNNEAYRYNNTISFDDKLKAKTLTDKKFRYQILNPLEDFRIILANEAINADIKLSGIYPIYVFPTTQVDENDEDNRLKEIEFWNRYEQRCKFTGVIDFKNGKNKKAKKNFSCYGQRGHSYGDRMLDRINLFSVMIVQFGDMSMNLTCMEVDDIPMSNGFISRRSGNVPIQKVELEIMSYNEKTLELDSSEFSYKDAQDDVDLLVSKKIHSMEMPVTGKKKKKFIRFRNFSDFTIIGTNKTGIGMEDHLISVNRLKSINS